MRTVPTRSISTRRSQPLATEDDIGANNEQTSFVISLQLQHANDAKMLGYTLVIGGPEPRDVARVVPSPVTDPRVIQTAGIVLEHVRWHLPEVEVQFPVRMFQAKRTSDGKMTKEIEIITPEGIIRYVRDIARDA